MEHSANYNAGGNRYVEVKDIPWKWSGQGKSASDVTVTMMMS